VDRFRACVRRELVFLALGTMEVCIITPLLAAFISSIIPVRPLPITGVFLGAVLAAHYLARVALRLPLHPFLRSTLLGLGMLVSGLLVVHQLLHAQTPLWDPVWLAGIFRDLQQENLSHDVILFLLVLFLWWRGLVLAQRRLESKTVVSRFRSGLVMLAVTTIVGGLILPWPPYRFVFVFFFVSLLGIALARAEEVGQQYGGTQSPFDLGWLATLVTASLLVLLLAAGVATLLTGENIACFIAPALELQRTLLNVLIYVLAWVVHIVSVFLFAVFGELDLEGLGRLLTPGRSGPPVQPQPPLFTVKQLELARGSGIIAGVLFLLLLVVFSLRRLRARAGRRRGEQRESVWEGVHLSRGLRDLLQDGRRRLNEAAAALSHSILSRLSAGPTIRRIYAHLGALSAELGYPRASYETPYEYLPTLQQSFPDNRDEVARITEAYVAVHYGEVPERPEDLALIQAAWERIRETVALLSP